MLTTKGGTSITTGAGNFETSYIDLEASAAITLSTGVSTSGGGSMNGGGGISGPSINMIGANFSTKEKASYEIMGRKSNTGISTETLAAVDLNYKAFGVGYESLKETLPSGQVNKVTKVSITLFGFSIERANSSSGAWSNEVKSEFSQYWSVLMGYKIKGSISLLKESYTPNE